MKTLLFSAKPYDRRFFDALAPEGMGVSITYTEARLTQNTAMLAKGYTSVCVFTNDELTFSVIQQLSELGVRLIALRCAGFNNVDLHAAEQFGISVVRVPAYSPYAVAEHTLALILCLNRHIHKAYNRVREGNFSLEGLMGFDLHGKTVGLVGTGKIGTITAGILKGFGCNLLAVDQYPNPDCVAMGVNYVELPTLLANADIISLHCPLTPETFHCVNVDTLKMMKPGVMIVNTSRGGLIDTAAIVESLKLGQVGALGIDVYEEEADLFFENLSDQVIQDDVFSRLLTFPNVLITGHQAFFTREAMAKIAEVTVSNIQEFSKGAWQNTVTVNR